MNLLEAIARADSARPNAIDDAVKASWIFELEGEFAEMMEAEEPQNTFPEDSVLLMPYPHDECYELYISAKIDNYNQETTLYANDRMVADAAVGAAKAWWRRTHKPNKRSVIRV